MAESPKPVTAAAAPPARRITREGRSWIVLSVGLAATGLYKGINLVTLLAYIMLILAFFNWRIGLRQTRLLSLRRWADSPAFAGTALEVTVEVRNPHRRACQGVHVEDRGAAHHLSWFVADLAGGERQRFRQDVVLPRRGWYEWPALRARSAFPFGLVESIVAAGPGEPLLVYPRLGRLYRGRLRRFLEMAAAMPGQARRKLQHHPAAQSEFHGLRDFRPGDSPRWIHWRTTARRGCLMVREFEELPSDHLILVLDPYVPETVSVEAEALLERAVSMAATICWEWCRQKGDALVLAVAGDAPVIQHGTTSLELAHTMLGSLAVAAGTHGGSSAELVDKLAQADWPRAPILVVSTRGDEIASALSHRLHRSVASVNVAELQRYDFYEEQPVDPPVLVSSLNRSSAG